MENLFRALPKVDEQIHILKKEERFSDMPEEMLKNAIRESIAQMRTEIGQGICEEGHLADFLSDFSNRVWQTYCLQTASTLKRVINGTGTILHTNLGRSIFGEEVFAQVKEVLTGYNNLEYDIEKGKRGSRYDLVEAMICKLTGAEAALVVNNNAAAVMLTLSTLCKEREVVVSRGELVEIGGSFRVPDVMAQSGALLKEVGTTNKTHQQDYESAISENTAALMKVHTSNYRIMGFTESVAVHELVFIAQKHEKISIEDIGSGVLVDLSAYGLPHEPMVKESVEAGMDVVTFSGDKLLGGPQAGIIVGKKRYIDKMKKNPLTRALRVDKLILSFLEASLKYYLDESMAIQKIESLRMITEGPKNAERKALFLLERLTKIDAGLHLSVQKTKAQIGGGALPLTEIDSYGLAIQEDAVLLEAFMRNYEIAIVGRIEKETYLLDMKTILDKDLQVIEQALSLYGQKKGED